MVQLPINVPSIYSGFTDRFVSSNGALPGARACSDGTQPMQVVQLYGWLSGKGATRSATMYAGSAAVGISVGASSSAQGTGYIATSVWNTFGGTGINYGYTSESGECYFGRGGAGGSTTPYSTLAGNLGMYVGFYQCQTAPTSLVVTPDSGGASAVLTWGAPSDDGGTARTGYRVQVANDSGFSSGLSTIDVSSSATGVTVTGLTPGNTYWFRVTSRNAVTDAASKLGGAWTAGVSAVMPNQPFNGTIYNAGAFREAKVERYSGSAWTPDVTANVFAGGAWVEVG